MLFESVANIQGEHKKERLRDAIKDVFDLGAKDIVVFRQASIFIKRWGGIPVMESEIVNKIKEVITKESEESTELSIVSDCITINTDGLFAEFGITSSDISAESKEKIKQRLKEQIRLSDKDVILFLNDKIVIRRFKLTEAEEEQRNREKRYNGLPKEELELLKKSIFESVEAEQEIISDIATHILGTELDFARITHNYFSKNYIKIFQKNIFDFLRENLSEEDIILEGLANLILRENWILVHTAMAINILGLVSDKNPNAENFLKNYSGEIELDAERNKYKLPEIIDKNGSKWNVPSIIGVVMQQKKMIEAAALKSQALENLKEHIENLYSKADELNEEGISIEKESFGIEHESVEKTNTELNINAEIKELREMLRRCKEEDAKRIQAEISDKMLILKKLVIKDDALFTKKKRLEHQSKLIAAKIEKINFEIAKLQKKYKEEEEKISQFLSSQQGADEKFNILSEALTLALMKRKIKI